MNATGAFIFRDGELAASDNSITLSAKEFALQIGRYMDDTQYSWNGTIDEVMIANRSLSASEVLAHYNAGKAKHADWDPNGKWNGAMKFDGINDYVRISNSASLSISDAITIEAWIKPNTLTGKVYQICTKWYPNSWQSYIYSGILRWRLSLTTLGMRDLDYTLPSESVGQWSQVVFTHDKNIGSKIFVNSVLKNSNENQDTLSASSDSVYLGTETALGSEWLNGSIDEVRIWNRGLSASEIRQQYYSSLNKFAPDKWLFVSNQTGLPAGTHTYYIYANGAGEAADYSDERVLRVS